jgi:nitric oxide reductase subunit B
VLSGVTIIVLSGANLSDQHWAQIEKYVPLSLWGLNLGLASMIIFNLFPGAVMPLYNVLQHGFWHARSHQYPGERWCESSNGRGCLVTSYSFSLAWCRW